MNSLQMGYINSVSYAMSQYARTQAVSRLAKLGLRLHFPKIPTGWIPTVHPADLTPAWETAGLPLRGVGYSTIGAIVAGTKTSARFWPTSPFYQAWLGGYLIQGEPGFGINNNRPEIDRLLQVALVDQRTWLKNYGCPQPEVSLSPRGFTVIEETTHQEYPAWLVEGVIQSNSDVGSGNRYTNGFFLYRTYELMFDRFGGVRLPFLSTLPPTWPLASYHPLELDCLGFFINIGRHGHWALLYCCAARWAGRAYFPELRGDAEQTLRQVHIVSG